MRAIILLGLVAAVFAQLDRDALRQAFDALDSDDDGSLELSELQAYYDNIDTNKDGFVNLHEYSASRPAGETAAQTKASFDYNDKVDGVVDNKIARSAITIVFNRLDANKNGKVTLEEFSEQYAKILAEIAAIVG
ncbi:probable calcium-binding protein CML27 [Pomacea canaliculata]|uniref:probable calcium-binding protein CML27 n=1 Tax=Pomacea canaliculata TaxID=400727 RepID=UPI000D729957|nr:probable calcium-binding protein CML27 [Pomacea canaliculata]